MGGLTPATNTTAPALNASGSKVLSWTAGNVSVANTTLTGACGAYIYANALSPKYKIIGINFAGSFTTVSGIFAITWSGGVIATVTCAA